MKYQFTVGPVTMALIIVGCIALGGVLHGIAAEFTNVAPSPTVTANAQFDECIAGWKDTIRAWNESTARLNATLGPRP